MRSKKEAKKIKNAAEKSKKKAERAAEYVPPTEKDSSKKSKKDKKRTREPDEKHQEERVGTFLLPRGYSLPHATFFQEQTSAEVKRMAEGFSAKKKQKRKQEAVDASDFLM